MCGIAGFTRFSNDWGDVDKLKQMGMAIAHRGPDACGEYLDDSVGLCHRRLSIVDLSEAGRQPMTYDNGNLVITFNGEIYNFPELRQTLVDAGHQFKSQTDTEVILALYHLEGVALLEKINGMFAFAIWDKAEQRLFIARDRIGKKPLYYYRQDNDLAFASELKSLLQISDIPRQIRLDAVHDFFAYQYVPDPKTIYQDIYKLEPGHYLTVDADGFEMHKYWDLTIKPSVKKSESEWESGLLDLIQVCTARRMISDVPLGAFLSGGVDSSAVVALMASAIDDPVTTCSIGFDEKKFNETEFAQIVADRYRTDHHQFDVHENVNENLVEIVSYFDEPFADPSLVPTYFVSKLARQRVTVALAGDGGDEIFAGYEKYSIDHIENQVRQLFPRWVRHHVFPFLAKLIGGINLRLFQRATSLLESLSHEAAMAFFISNSQISDNLWQKLVRPEINEQLGDYHPSKMTVDFYNGIDAPDHLARILYTDLKTYLPGGILVKVDRMSMANSLEVRAPILDKEMVEFASTIPSHFKFREGEKKYLLKKAFRKLLPEEILYRKKMGFSVPLASWLRQDLKSLTEERLLRRSGGLSEIFNLEAIRDLWQEHQNGDRDHSTVLWSMLIYQLWWDRYMAPEADA